MKGAIRKLLAITLILAISCLPVAAYAVPEDTVASPFAERVDMDPPLWYQLEFESLEEMLELCNMAEDEYYELVDASLYPEKKHIARREREITDLGGTVGIVNVMVNGEFAQFEDAVPEIANGTTFAPVRPVLELLGASVSFDAADQSITAVYGDEQRTFFIGKTEMITSKGGGFVETFDIDYASYLKNGSAYIPVRTVFESFGCSVFWDADYKTVVVIDKAAVTARIDEYFTTANKLLTMLPAAPEGAYKTTADVTLGATLLDTIFGDISGKATASLDCLHDGDSIGISVEYEAEGKLIDALYDDLFGYAETTEGAIPAAFRASKLEMIFNASGGLAYFKAPLLNAIDSLIPEDAWLIMDFEGLMSFDTKAASDYMLGDITVGRIIYDSVLNNSYYLNPINLHRSLMTKTNKWATLFGDNKFEQVGDSYMLTVGADKSEIAASAIGLYASTLEYAFTIETDGSTITGVSGSLRLDGSLTIAGSFDVTAQSTDLSLSMQLEDVISAQLDVTAKTDVYSGEIPGTPPEGETVVSYDDIY